MASIDSYILDTSAYSAFKRGDSRLREWFTWKHAIFVPLIVVGELRAGFAAGSQTEENEALFRRFLDTPNVSQLPLTAATTEHFATLFLQLRKEGIAMSTNDLWIAAIARQHNLSLATCDAHFDLVPELRIERW